MAFWGTADIRVHVVHTSRVIMAYTMESLSPLTLITHNLQYILYINTLLQYKEYLQIYIQIFIRARHLFFPQLVRRTTIKQYGLVRNRNLLGHDKNILPFSKKNRGELYICIFILYFKITVSEAHCHIMNNWCSSLKVFFCPL